ncbi:MAG: hypothetical protein KKA05_11075 [Alphaproteobacteria bacterium]|nr:hypothetical protein [Alphaproteobacteria bacterium]
MSWDEIYKNMAFSPFKTEYARTRQVRDAIVTLHSYIQGTARNYEVYDALQFLEREFGISVALACRAFETALGNDDEISREIICQEALNLLEKALLRYNSSPPTKSA